MSGGVNLPSVPEKPEKPKAPKTAEERREFLRKLKASTPQRKAYEFETPAQLPRWAYNGLIDHLLFGATDDQIAAKYGKKRSTVRAYRRSPAFGKLKHYLRPVMDDPHELAKRILEPRLPQLSRAQLSIVQRAMKKGDHATALRAMTDIQDRVGLQKRQEQAPPVQQIIINLPAGAQVDVPRIESTHERLEPPKEAEWEIEES